MCITCTLPVDIRVHTMHLDVTRCPPRRVASGGARSFRDRPPEGRIGQTQSNALPRAGEARGRDPGGGASPPLNLREADVRDFAVQVLKVSAVWLAFLAHPVIGIFLGAVVIADVGVGS